MTEMMKSGVFKINAHPKFSVSVDMAHLPVDIRSIFDSPKYAIFPGFCDVHVHFREPGFS